MPNTKNQTFRIKIIDDLLSRKQWVKTSQMKNAIESKLLETFSERTIQKDIKDMIEDTRLGYNAPIIYDNRRKAYSYEERGYTIKNFSLQPEEITALQFYAECLQVFSGYKLFDSFTSGIKKVINGVQVKSKLKTSTNAKTIIQTDSLVTPKGQSYMEDIVYAIDNKYRIDITYKQYNLDKTSVRSLFPVFLKEYRNRWYLIAFRLDNSEIRTYSLDRIHSLKMFDEESIKKDFNFNPEKYFEHSFGITTPDAPVETIILRFTKKEAAYINSLPIHKTQQTIKETSRYVTISIQVIMSYEVYAFILSKTPEVKVLSPVRVATEIGNKLKEASKLYK